jgi:hypothetical protein
MPIPDDLTPHPPSSQFSGTIHFRGEYAYLQNLAQDSWSLLQFDSPFSGALNFTSAAQTAARLGNSYNENDPIRLSGVILNTVSDGAPLSVLFVDGVL